MAKLYLRSRYFLCRHCHQLAYSSQSEARHDRLLRRRNKLSARLNPGADRLEVLPPRPKGMWRTTYETRLEEIFRLEEEAEAEFVAWFARRFPGVEMDSILHG